jgi:outer membrane PBP1 activator LpoA protein
MRPGKTLPDMVFFIGGGSDVSVMMETLSRNGGGNLPVYSTAQVLVGQRPDQRANGLRLCVSPWQAGSGPLRTDGATAASADTEMLFAMGADAQALYTRLTTLDGNPSLHIPGNTGYLSMDTHRRVVRTLVWGVMQDGQLQVQPASGHL